MLATVILIPRGDMDGGITYQIDRKPYIQATMIRLFQIAGVLCATALYVSPAAAMPDGRKFSVVNLNASASIQQVWYARISTNDPWTEIAVDFPIKPNHRSLFTLPAGDACLYNVKLGFSDGSEQALENVNVCRCDDVTAN